ncbi:MAG: hypothetical protein AAGE52_09350 [Myxococcota bacterium]
MIRMMLVACVALAAGCFGGGGEATYDEGNSGGEEILNSTVTIFNDSDYAIFYLYMSPTSQDTWGPDQLGSEIIAGNGGTFTLTDIACDSYDVRLVDEDECIVPAVDICAEDAGWHITNEDLLRCQGYIN